MYRKYLQELNDRPATSQRRASPDTVFPDTNLIVGEAHLKAARAGAAHREQLGSPRLNNAVAHHSSAAESGPVVDQPSAAQFHSPPVAIVHSPADGPSIVRPVATKPDNRRAAVRESATTTRSNTYEAEVAQSSSAKNDSLSRSPARSAVGMFTRCGSAVNYSPEINKFEGRGRRDQRRHAEVMELEDIMSRDNTPEFRRRPVDFSLTSVEDATPVTRAGMSSRSSRPSPISVWDSQSIPDVSEDEVIMARPVMEASRVKSPLYPTPRGDLLSSSLMESTHSRHANSLSYSQDVIMVRSASPDSKASVEQVEEEPKTRRENGLPKAPRKFCGSLQGELIPWGRNTPPPRPPSKKAGATREATNSGCYSMFCCSARPSSTTNRRQ